MNQKVLYRLFYIIIAVHFFKNKNRCMSKLKIGSTKHWEKIMGYLTHSYPSKPSNLCRKIF